MAHLVMQEMHTISCKIKTGTGSGSTATMSDFGAGIDNMQEQLNEVVQQYKFLTDGGFSRSRVTAMAPVWTFSGRRIFGDAAQDYICDTSRKYGFGASRETELEISYTANGFDYKITADITIANVQEFSGATEEASAFSCELHIDGAPTCTKTSHTGG